MGAYCKRGNRNRQVEAPRSSAAGIDKESPAQFFDYRLVRMAGDDSRESRGSWIELELRQVMKDVDCVAANLDHIVCGKTATPSARVVIATHGSDRRNGSERVQNRWVADVAAMNDEVRVVERIEASGRIKPWVSAIRPTRCSEADTRLKTYEYYKFHRQLDFGRHRDHGGRAFTRKGPEPRTPSLQRSGFSG